MDYDKLIERLKSAAGGPEGIKMCHDAALAIKALRDDLARVTAERDGAIEDLEETMFKGRRNIDTCEYCKNAKCYARGGIQACNPVWRGIEED